MPTSKMISEQSEINISGYNLDNSIWTLLNDRVVVRKRGFGGKLKEQEILLKDIVAIGYFYSNSSSGSGSIYLQLTPGKIHRGITLHSDSPDQLSALHYIKNHYGRLYETSLQKKQVEDAIEVKQDEIRQQLREGKLCISAEKFYRLCKRNNIQKLDNNFFYAKAKQQMEMCIRDSVIIALCPLLKMYLGKDYDDSIMGLLEDTKPLSWGERKERDDMLALYGVPEYLMKLEFSDEECNYYFQKERMEQFMVEGKETSDGIEEKKQEEEKIPKAVTPNQTEEEFLQRVSQLLALCGNRKRERMLTDLIQDLEKRIEELKQGEEAMKQLGIIYAQQQKKEGDWAIAGGLADGLAGPVAGYMAASQVMEKNREIQQHNAIMRETSMNILKGIPNMTADRTKLREERNRVELECADAGGKIVLSSPDSAEIWNHLQVGSYQIKKAESGVLHIALPVCIKTPFVLDVPDDVKTVVDGTLKAEVQFEGKNVGFVNFPLPLYGIPTNMTAEVTLDGMLDRSVEFNGEYTLKMLDSHNLWIMEA